MCARHRTSRSTTRQHSSPEAPIVLCHPRFVPNHIPCHPRQHRRRQRHGDQHEAEIVIATHTASSNQGSAECERGRRAAVNSYERARARLRRILLVVGGVRCGAEEVGCEGGDRGEVVCGASFERSERSRLWRPLRWSGGRDGRLRSELRSAGFYGCSGGKRCN